MNLKLIRLFYLFSYIKKLQEAVKGKPPKKEEDEAAANEYQIKIIALKTTSNISTLIRDLFHNPPIFRSVVQLSWITKKSNVSLKSNHVDSSPITSYNQINKNIIYRLYRIQIWANDMHRLLSNRTPQLQNVNDWVRRIIHHRHHRRNNGYTKHHLVNFRVRYRIIQAI